MKYKVTMYGPYGPQERSAQKTLAFKTEEERDAYLNKPKQLETVRDVFEEGETEHENNIVKSNKTVHQVLRECGQMSKQLEALTHYNYDNGCTNEQRHDIGNAMQALIGVNLFLRKVKFK